MDWDRLEEQRQTLEQSLTRIRTGLRHWQTWEAEYEGLKEEILARPGLSPSAIADISTSYGGQLVNEREIRELTGFESSAPRNTQQILGLISRRQEYVQKNIDTLQRQFWDAEAKLEEFDFVSASAGKYATDTALPLTEIHEELDDDDNVISSTVSQPEASTAKLVDALRKAGVSDSDLSGGHDDGVKHEPATGSLPPGNIEASLEQSGSASTAALSSVSGEADLQRQPIRKKSVSFTADTKPAPDPVRTSSEDGTKSVSFADKVAVAPAAPAPDTRSVSFSPTVEEIPAITPGQCASPMTVPLEVSQTLLEVTAQPTVTVPEPTDGHPLSTGVMLPETESEEDARTRREMLDYHLNEVGHVVAQMDLDEGYEDGDDAMSASDFASSEYFDEDTPYTSSHSDASDDDAEDQYGRSTKRIISDAYHKEMLDLQTRLIGNLGPIPTSQDIKDIDTTLDPQDVRKLVVRDIDKSVQEHSSDEKKPDMKKRVSFAETLNIQDNDAPEQQPKESLDRTDVSNAVNKASTMAKKSNTNENQSGRSGQIMADQLKERTPTDRQVVNPSAEDMDPVMQRRELAAEYYRRRNDIIHQQGGFTTATNRSEEDEGELMEERDGKMKKVSRFKAARIRS